MFKPFDKRARPLVTAAALGLILATLAGLAPASSATIISPAAHHRHAPLFPDFRAHAVSPLGDATPMTAMRTYRFGGLNSSVNYNFTKIDDNNGNDFTELLGISNDGRIAGFFQPPDGTIQDGFRLEPPYAQNDFKNENVTGALNTVVTSIDQNHDLGGFYVDSMSNTLGFVKWHGVVRMFSDPNTNPAGRIAVGAYYDVNDLAHGFMLNVRTGQFTDVAPSASSGDAVEATGINDENEIVGYVETTSPSFTIFGFLLKGNETFEFAHPNGIETAPFGINDSGEIVGAYLDQNEKLHGFTLTNLKNPNYRTIDDPNSVTGKATFSIVTGVNDKGDLVGYYLSAEGHTHGFLATP